MIETILLILIAVFSILLQIFIHEVGHLVFGLMTGYKFISFTILNIRVYKRDKKICVGKTRVAGAGGQCAMTPAFEENDNIPYFWYNAGGIIFNLITSIIMGLLGFCFNEGSLARTLLMFSGIIGLVFALYNGIPIRSRLVVNDAYNIFMMFNNPSARRAFWRIMKINASGAETRKLLKLPKEWFYELPDKDYRNPLLCGLAVDTIYYYLEKQYYNEALEICNEIIGTKGVFKNQQAELTKNEVKILYYLFKHAGKICSRNDIVDFLWDNQLYVDDNALSVNINRIRDKLSSIGLNDFIRTKHRQGYTL